MQIGVFTAGDLDPAGIVALAVAAENAGFDVFAVGEHHNPPYTSSCPATLLAHIAARTRRIVLSTATTLITTNDPAKIAAEYATLHHLAPGRTDLVLGRGNTAKVFGWFGKEIEYSVPLTIEHYAALRELWPDRPYVWHACTRSPEIADLAAEHDDGLFVFAGQTEHVARYREQAAHPRLGVLADLDDLGAALDLRPDRLLVQARHPGHLRQITKATTRISTPTATADPSTHSP